MMNNIDDNGVHPGYIITGRAAHGRIGNLFQNLLQEKGQTWVDQSPYSKNQSGAPSTSSLSRTNDNDNDNDKCSTYFLWENAPRSETKSIRDNVKCYSHLPNGILLDDKWALARLLGCQLGGAHRHTVGHTNATNATNDPNLVTLESHCFRGSEFALFARRLGLLDRPIEDPHQQTNSSSMPKYQFEDLLPRRKLTATANKSVATPPPSPSNLWVLKDAMSNGAGGIWIVDESNVSDFLINDDDEDEPSNLNNANTSVLHPTHRYIAQRYAWPPTLYNGRKCHVRVYALITCDGRAYVHRKAFLHVANELFEDGQGGDEGNYNTKEEPVKRPKFEPSVHITNCCANSHDLHKFAGEICVDLETMPSSDRERDTGDNNNAQSAEVLPLGDYFPSISASVAALAQSFAQFIRGGEPNGGFEYLGLDFVLSSVEAGSTSATQRKPVAYLLEVNAPPSQDTATGLSHAEALHDEVIFDLLRMWVLPNVLSSSTNVEERNRGGWRCVYKPRERSSNITVPSRAAFTNRMRWAMVEKRALRNCEKMWNTLTSTGLSTGTDSTTCESITNKPSFDTDAFVSFVRSQFPYFSSDSEISIPPEEGTNRRRIPIFFKSGGGAQVPHIVSNAMMTSLSNRDRSVAGTIQQRDARKALTSLLTNDICSTNCDEENKNLVVLRKV